VGIAAGWRPPHSAISAGVQLDDEAPVGISANAHNERRTERWGIGAWRTSGRGN
jgi:hypothetical protein